MAYIYQPKIEYVDNAMMTQTILFQYPPEGDPRNEAYDSKWQDNYSERGSYVRVLKFILHTFRLKFKFVTPTIQDQVRGWYENYGAVGTELKLFPQHDQATFHTVRCMTKKLMFERHAYDAGMADGDNFYYAFDLEFERTLVP